jgi:acetyl-CoA carboxylase carboxyl transferase subunit alpha
VISPEGCASILWKSAEKAPEAAEALGLTAARLKELGLVDQIIPEPLGAAHRDVDTIAARLKRALLEHLEQLDLMPLDDLLAGRYHRLMGFGGYAQREDKALVMHGIGAPPPKEEKPQARLPAPVKPASPNEDK